MKPILFRPTPCRIQFMVLSGHTPRLPVFRCSCVRIDRPVGDRRLSRSHAYLQELVASDASDEKLQESRSDRELNGVFSIRPSWNAYRDNSLRPPNSRFCGDRSGCEFIRASSIGDNTSWPQHPHRKHVFSRSWGSSRARRGHRHERLDAHERQRDELADMQRVLENLVRTHVVRMSMARDASGCLIRSRKRSPRSYRGSAVRFAFQGGALD